MRAEQQIVNHQNGISENQQIREMVIESYRDITTGKGRDCNKFFDELEKRYTNDRV